MELPRALFINGRQIYLEQVYHTSHILNMDSNKVTKREVADLKKQVAALREQLEKKNQLIDEIISRVTNYTA